MFDSEKDKRKNMRADVHFVVAYGRKYNDDLVDRDVSQTRNISEGGMLMTTSRPFEPMTSLSLNVKLPVYHDSVQVNARVLESRQVHSNLVYFTRLEFTKIDEDKRKAIEQTVAYYTRKNRLSN
ncbi:MAG: PilZ domain-containing protein [Candidatus Omnitrophica bacterium]|jgi:c-di-GMP-binding flagellar brake protein YcgR|nr:PilZ domain-containing protein [Candidatus Omnitrophota bacterium]